MRLCKIRSRNYPGSSVSPPSDRSTWWHPAGWAELLRFCVPKSTIIIGSSTQFPAKSADKRFLAPGSVTAPLFPLLPPLFVVNLDLWCRAVGRVHVGAGFCDRLLGSNIDHVGKNDA